MSHDNITERREHVQFLLERDSKISMEEKRNLATRFGCSLTAIHRDIAALRDPVTYSGYRDMDAANVQNNRARRLGVTGTFTGQEFRSLREQYGNRCAICGETKPLGPDHIRPLSKGGTNWISNIQPVCLPCNSRKGAKWKRKK